MIQLEYKGTSTTLMMIEWRETFWPSKHQFFNCWKKSSNDNVTKKLWKCLVWKPLKSYRLVWIGFIKDNGHLSFWDYFTQPTGWSLLVPDSYWDSQLNYYWKFSWQFNLETITILSGSFLYRCSMAFLWPSLRFTHRLWEIRITQRPIYTSLPFSTFRDFWPFPFWSNLRRFSQRRRGILNCSIRT